MNRLQLLFFFGALLSLNSVFSQDLEPAKKKDKSHISYRIGYGHMHVIATNDFLRTENLNGSPITQGRNISTEIIFQTTGTKDWHQLYSYPKFGFGIQYLWFPQTKEIGNPLAVYGMFESPIHRWKNAQLDWGFHFGIAVGWNPQSPTNPYNVLLGSKGSLYAHLGIIYHQNITKHLGLEASVGFSHASNGALKMPNFGINLFDPRLAITYSLEYENKEFKKQEITPSKTKNEISLSYAIGTKQIDVSGSDSISKAQFENTSFTIYNFVLLYQRQISFRSKIGAGFDFTMDPSDNAHGRVVGDENSVYPPTFDETAKLALVISYELSIGKLSLILQPGFYMYRTTHDPTPFFYQRIGTRYDIYKGFYAGASLRAVNFGQADWVELTLGYKLKF
jgi:hypothetical protein